jgi:hypothetical protein
MGKSKPVAVVAAAAAALSLSDQWLSSALPASSVNKVRAAPSMPLLTGVQLLIEENESKQCNGANLVLTFAEGSKAKGKRPAVAELWVSREINLLNNGQYEFPGIIVTSACGLDTRRDLGAMGNAVALRFGQQGDGDDTYFASQVPSNAALDKLMEDAVKACNASPELLKDFQAKGWIKAITGRDGKVTHVVEFPASKIGYSPILFCPIGKDGKPTVNPASDNWSSTRNKGSGWLFRWVKDPESSAIVAQPETERGSNRQARRNFRGQTFKNGSRMESVARHILAQIQASKVWAEIQKVNGMPYAERQKITGAQSTGRPRFVSMAPQAMGRPSTVASPAGAVESAEIEL